jgi:L-ribulose-5-phosphate 4-epimerase
MNEEGVIKFNCTWIKEAPLSYGYIEELNVWRDKLYKEGLIGENKDGIGYGNISCRYKENTFIITGSGTGSLAKLNAEHYTRVTAYNFAENTLTTSGPVKASSESLTHAAIYESSREVNVVFHVHHLALWKKLLAEGSSTAEHIEYGTPAMAAEITKLMHDPSLRAQRILAMGGHEEGILSFGKTAREASEILGDWIGRL